MPALQSIVLTDRATTPVNHTFVKRDVNRDGVGTVIETTGVPIGNSRLSVSLRKTPSGKYKGVVVLAIPIVATQTINGVDTPVIARTAYVNSEFTFDETSTEQERKNAVGMFASALDAAKPLVNDTLVKLEGVY